MIGNVNIDDFDLKIRRILRNSQHHKEVLKFPIGKFLYPQTDALIQFDKYQQRGKPYELTPYIEQDPKPKPKNSLWQKIVKALGASTK